MDGVGLIQSSVHVWFSFSTHFRQASTSDAVDSGGCLRNAKQAWRSVMIINIKYSISARLSMSCLSFVYPIIHRSADVCTHLIRKCVMKQWPVIFGMFRFIDGRGLRNVYILHLATCELRARTEMKESRKVFIISPFTSNWLWSDVARRRIERAPDQTRLTAGYADDKSKYGQKNNYK